MNEETKQFIENKNFDKLFRELSKSHKPVKAEIDNKKLEALGLIIIKFQRLENTIRWFIGVLANICNDQPLVNILTVKNSFNNLLLVLSAISTHKNFHREEELELLINQCYKAEEIRNQLIHSVWTSGLRLKTGLKKKNGVQHKSENYSAEELFSIADKIDKLDTSIDAIQFGFIQNCSDKRTAPNGVKFIK